MRQMFTSPRLENVEGVAPSCSRDAGIENKISEGRGYKKVSRREFSYVEKKNAASNQPAVWVIKSDDYKRAREMLLGMGLLDQASRSVLPARVAAVQGKGRGACRRARIGRMRLALLFVAGAMVFWTILQMTVLR